MYQQFSDSGGLINRNCSLPFFVYSLGAYCYQRGLLDSSKFASFVAFSCFKLLLERFEPSLAYQHMNLSGNIVARMPKMYNCN